MDKEIAVVIPTFNRVDLTVRAIESVVGNDPNAIEIIVVDDCGSLAFKADTPTNSHGISIRTFRTSYNGGPGLARRFAVERFGGMAVAFLDSDDRFDRNWIDYALDEMCSGYPDCRNSTIIVGKARNGTYINRFCLDVLRLSPQYLRLFLVRIAALMFNPFYTSAVVLSRELCIFHDSLRYCEDYYMNAIAVFKARRIVISPSFVVSIARKPGSKGGLSNMKYKMFSGEMAVRRAIFSSEYVPPAYKALVPVGMLYQVLRTAFKTVI